MKTKENNLSDKWADSRWAIRPLVSREVYTDREEHLEYLYKAALDANSNYACHQIVSFRKNQLLPLTEHPF